MSQSKISTNINSVFFNDDNNKRGNIYPKI